MEQLPPQNGEMESGLKLPFKVETQETYDNPDFIHQSMLSSLHNGNYEMLDPERADYSKEALEQKDAVKNGTLFDEYMETGTITNVGIRSFPRPTHTLGTLCDELVSRRIDPNNASRVGEIIDDANLWKSDSVKKKAERRFLDDDAIGYVLQELRLREIPESRILDEDSYIQIKDTAERSREAFNMFYANSPQHDGKRIVILDQVILRFGKFVGKLDKVVINYTDKTIRIVDIKLKNQKNIWSWGYSFFKYAYYVQYFVYRYLMEGCLAMNPDKEWRVVGMDFFVCSIYNNQQPIVYPINIDLGDRTFFTFEPVDEYGNEYPCVDSLLEDYLYMQNTGNWNYPPEVQRLNYVLPINLT